MKPTKCDACHEEKPLLFFPTFDGGFVAYCKEDAVKKGYNNMNPHDAELDHEHFDEFYYCPICMQYQYPKSDKGEG